MLKNSVHTSKNPAKASAIHSDEWNYARWFFKQFPNKTKLRCLNGKNLSYQNGMYDQNHSPNVLNHSFIRIQSTNGQEVLYAKGELIGSGSSGRVKVVSSDTNTIPACVKVQYGSELRPQAMTFYTSTKPSAPPCIFKDDVSLKNNELYLLQELGQLLAHGNEAEPGVPIKSYSVLKKHPGDCMLKYFNQKQTPLSPMRIREMSLHKKYLLALRLAEQVAVLHEKNIIHNDIKLENFTIVEVNQGEDFEVHLLDFGFGFILPDNIDHFISRNRQGEISSFGSPAYTNQFFIRKGHYSKINDIYALGCIFTHTTTWKDENKNIVVPSMKILDLPDAFFLKMKANPQQDHKIDIHEVIDYLNKKCQQFKHANNVSTPNSNPENTLITKRFNRMDIQYILNKELDSKPGRFVLV